MSIFDQLLKDQLEKLKDHQALVGAGIPSEQALRITHGDKIAGEVQENLKLIEKKSLKRDENNFEIY